MDMLKSRFGWMTGATMKMVVIGALALALVIPMLMIWLLIYQRTDSQQAAVREVSGMWGGAQTLRGPILALPYRVDGLDRDGKSVSSRHMAYFLPRTLEVQAEVPTETRRRGNFDVILYKANLSVKGEFSRSSLGLAGAAGGVPLWNEAAFLVGVTDPRGLSGEVVFHCGENKRVMEPTSKTWNLLGKTLRAALPLSPDPESIPFDFQMKLQGHESLMVGPLAANSRVEMKSPWKSPSFCGGALPSERKIGASGFTSVWDANRYGLGIPLAWKDEELYNSEIENSDLGAKFLVPVDAHDMSNRAIKYSTLFVALTFLGFFLMEVIGRLRIHPIQYGFVGLSLVLFFLLLLALSERLSFEWAYAGGALAVVLSITGYCRTILAQGRRALSMGLGLTGLYGCLYVLLRVEDYALLMGSILLFLILSGVMFVTRKIDWYRIGDL